jgi:CelD/BcsL family acetyltransferase involved in cellulose biosynthesis
VERRKPRSSPAWVLAWYRHYMPPGALARVAVVHDAGQLVGVAPFHVERSGFGLIRYEMAAPVMNGVEPLCAPGRDDDVGMAIGGALAKADPVPDIVSLDWLTVDSRLRHAVPAGWRRSLAVQRHEFSSPRITFEGCDFTGWLATRSRNFRKSFQSDLRKLRAEGSEHQVMRTPEEIGSRLAELRRLFEFRRAGRGGAGHPFDDRFEAMVRDAVAHSPAGRVTLATLERPGEVIAADLVITAGDEASAWFGGFGDEWSHLSPGRANVALCVSDTIDAGQRALDLGPGVEPYKFSFTDEESTLQGCLVVRRGLRPFHSPAQLLPYETRQSLARAVGRLRRR